MVLPSGETSSESQVPSSVVNSTFRSDFSGRPFFSSFFFVLLLFFPVLLLTGGILLYCAGVQRCCAAKNDTEDHCQNNEPRSQTAQTGLLHIHDRLPPYRLAKLLTWESQIDDPLVTGQPIDTPFCAVRRQ